MTHRNESPKKSAATKIIMAITALILLGSGYCFSQSNKTEQMINTNIGQEEHIAALEKRIAEAGDDFVSLTMAEYELLLSRPVGKVDGFEPLVTTAGGIMVGIGFDNGFDNRPKISFYPKNIKSEIEIIFPKIPNIGEGEVFVIFDFVKGTNGLDFLERNNTEEEGGFTQLALDIRTAGSKSYWFGSRYVHLLDPKDDRTVRVLGDLGGEVEVSAVSGKVIMHLPTNITGIALKKEDVGIEKSFAGSFLTLKEINKDRISFQFSGDPKRIYTWEIYDGNGNTLDEDENGYLMKNGLFEIAVKNPQSIKIYQSETVKKEYPFAFGNESHATSEGVSSIEEEKLAPSVQTKDTIMNNIQTKHVAPVYLDKNDPISISIKGRALTDLKQLARSFDPELAENKSLKAQVNTWTKEKQNQLQDIGGKSIEDYTAQTHFDAGTFLLLASSFGKLDQKKIVEKWDIRVQYLGGDKYVAEFWEDGLAENSEDYVLAAALSTLASMGNPQERYIKVMALLYTLEKDGSITFHDPLQPVIDLFKTIEKKPGGRPQGDL